MARGSRTTGSVGMMSAIRGRVLGGRRDRAAERHEANTAQVALMERTATAEGAAIDAMEQVRANILAGANAENVRAEWDELYTLLVDCSKAMSGHPQSVIPEDVGLRLAMFYTDVAEILTASGPLARGVLDGTGIAGGRRALTENERQPYLVALHRAVGGMATIAEGRRMIVRAMELERADRR